MKKTICISLLILLTGIITYSVIHATGETNATKAAFPAPPAPQVVQIAEGNYYIRSSIAQNLVVSLLSNTLGTQVTNDFVGDNTNNNTWAIKAVPQPLGVGFGGYTFTNRHHTSRVMEVDYAVITNNNRRVQGYSRLGDLIPRMHQEWELVQVSARIPGSNKILYRIRNKKDPGMCLDVQTTAAKTAIVLALNNNDNLSPNRQLWTLEKK